MEHTEGSNCITWCLCAIYRPTDVGKSLLHTPVNRTFAKTWLEKHWIRRNAVVTCAENNSHFGANIHCRLMHFFKCCRHWGSHPREPSQGQGSSLGEALCGLGCTDAAPGPDFKVKSKTSAVRWGKQSAQVNTMAAIRVSPAAKMPIWE